MKDGIMKFERFGGDVGFGFSAIRNAVAVLIGLGVAVSAGCQKPPAVIVPPPPAVGVVESRRMAVPIEISLNGTTRAMEEVVVKARVRGFLTEKHFEEGSLVKKGQLLFVIDEVPYRIALEQARAKQDEANATLTKAEQSKVREIAQAQLALDQAQLNLGLVEENRAKSLQSRNAASREDVDRAEANRKKYEAQVGSDKASLEQAKADYDVGILAAKAQVEAARAAVRDAEINLGYCRMTAAIDGRIGEAKIKIGNLVGPELGAQFSELATIQQLDPMSVDMRPSARYLERITKLTEQGLEVRLTRTGLEGEMEYAEGGRAYFIDNTIDPTTSTFLMKAKLPNPNGVLLPGAYVGMKFTVEKIDDAVVVPETAVMETEAGPVVYVIDKDNKVTVQRVDAGPTYQGQRILHSGLDSGVPVIVEGLQLIRPGLEVKAEPARMPRGIDGKLTAREERHASPDSKETTSGKNETPGEDTTSKNSRSAVR